MDDIYGQVYGRHLEAAHGENITKIKQVQSIKIGCYNHPGIVRETMAKARIFFQVVLSERASAKLPLAIVQYKGTRFPLSQKISSIQEADDYAIIYAFQILRNIRKFFYPVSG